MTAPASPSTADPTAVVGRRFVAAVIDLGILWVFTAGFWALASRRLPDQLSQLGFEACTGRNLCTDVNDRYVAGWPNVVLALVWTAYLLGVFVVERGLTGRTVGTMVTGLVTVGEDGRPLGIAPALVRSVAGIVDYVPCCVPLVGIVTTTTTGGHRRVGDMAARSYVVGHEWFGRPIVLPGPTQPSDPPAPPPSTIPRTAPIPPGATPPVPPDVVGGPAPTPSPTDPPDSRSSRPASPTQSASDGPIWDPDRRAYLQWDAARRQWLQFDQASGQWHQYDHTAGRWRPLDR